MTQVFPQLDPREHKLLEKLAGRRLSNAEAQEYQHKLRLQ
jgi:hypothetical protein